MISVKPLFYDRFSCIADACDFTCCQEWKIAVDEKTNAKWKKMSPPQGTKTRRKNLSLFTKFKDGDRVIALDGNHICPFLNDEKLCRLVIQYGDDCLSETCRIFPREIHHFEDHEEYALMPCCPAVVDFLREEGEFKLSDEFQEVSLASREFQVRKLVMEIMQTEEYSIEECLLACFFVLTAFLNQEDLTVEEVQRSLPGIMMAIEEIPVDMEEHLEECRELYLDLVENYQRERLYGRWITMGFDMAQDGSTQNLKTLAVNWDEQKSDYCALLRCLLTEELYADLVMPEGDLESMVIKMEWIIMEYVLLRQFLRFAMEEEGRISYEKVRSYVVLVCRMMGYEEEDIREYMENSFADTVWDVGYVVLLLGK